MFIETALKNIALNTIMTEIDSSSVYDMYDKAISSYKNAPAGTREDIKKKYQNNKLNLQGSIQNAIAAAYRKENPKITHFYNNVNYNEVPIWAIFEILTMGEYYGTAEPPVRCGESNLSGLTEPLHFVY